MSRTTTEEAKEIRKEYKALGWNSRMVSVRSQYFSMGSSIDVTVKDPAVNSARAKAIAEGKERIRRCELSGEILSGGNRYVSLNHSSECQEVLSRRYIEALTEALELCDPTNVEGNRTIHPIKGHPFAGVRLENTHTGQVWGESGFLFQFYPDDGGVKDAAFRLALLDADQVEGEPNA